jgi:CHAT domain-containing protein
MRHKFFRVQKYIRIFLAALVIYLYMEIAQIQSLNVTAVANPVTPASSAKEYTNATYLAQKGTEFYAAEQFSKAVNSWQLAAKVFQTQGNILNQATALNHLSLAYQQLGSYPQASLAIASSLNLLQTGQKISGSKEHLKILAQTLNIQGQLQLAQGQAQLALSTWNKSATTYTQLGDRVGLIGNSINQAQAMQVLGLYRQALVTLNSIQKTLRSMPDSQLKVAQLNSLGNALRVVGDLGQSRQILQQSLTLAQKLESSSDISAALFSLGNTARTQQDTKSAKAFYQQAITASTEQITQLQSRLNQLSLLLDTKQLSAAQTLLPQIRAQVNELPPSRTTIYAQINFAQSLMRLGQSAPADASLRLDTAQLLAKAIRQAKDLGDQPAQAYAQGTLGRLYEQDGQLTEAENLTQQALVLAQSLNAPDISYRFSWQLGRLLKAKGDSVGAIASYTQAVSNLKSLRRDLATINPEIQFSFREEVEPVYRELVDLLLRARDNSQPSQENLVQARNVIESLQLAELDNFFRTACLEGNPVQIDQVIDQEDPTAAILYPIILADRLEIILKLPGQPLRHYQTKIAQDEVEKRIIQLRQNLTKEYLLPEARSLSNQVYDWLVQPAEIDLAKSKVKTLVFVLDGVLRNIPMSALYDGKQYLVEKYAVALTPGLQLLPPQPIGRVKLNALTGGLTKAHQGFSALANVALELNQIKSEVSSTTLLNEQFTSATLEKELNETSFRIVHLATHGQFSSQAAKTFVLAWDKPINVDELNNLLQLRDTTVRRNPLELLVLSACETAKGDNRAALGLAGVAIRSGARSTLASLWSIDDAGTAVLMSEFYRELTQRKLNRAEALRQAQLALLRDPTYQHPRYWSAYVLVGNWL